jgi:rhamnosyltransferase
LKLASKISVVIPTKNGGDLFRELMTKLDRQVTSFSYEIIIVDSGSRDNTKEVAAKYGARVLNVPSHEFNHGATRNVGIKACDGEIVVLMTQDAIPANASLLEALARPFFIDPNVAGAYARQSPRPEADALTARNLNLWLTGRNEAEIRWIEDRNVYDKMSPLERYLFCNFDNVCSAIRRNVWQEMPFNPMNFGEDVDWSKRVLEAGWKIGYIPDAHVIHSHDRPISYEYKRTYMCHQTLYRLFGLCTVPSPKHALKSLAYATLSDWRFVVQQRLPLQEKLKLALKIPSLAMASVWGQYAGARDGRLGLSKKKSGV